MQRQQGEEEVRESRIEKEGKRWAEDNGWLTIKYRGERGYPDRIFIKGTVHVWVEIKRPGGVPTGAQYYRIRELKEAGANALWTDSFCGIKTILNEYDPTN
jgi:hypothetical protein